MVVCGSLFLLLPFVVEIAVGDVSILSNPGKRCVPTSTQTGPCHVCVCTTSGVFHCREVKCQKEQTTSSRRRECEPHYTYRQDTIICSCDHTGHWRSLYCKNRFNHIQPQITHTVKIGTNIDCTPGHFYITGCNICVCNDQGVIHFDSCTNRKCNLEYKDDSCNRGDVIRTTKELCACSDINYFIDRMCLKIEDEVIQEVSAYNLDTVFDVGSHWDSLKNNCKPYYTFNIDCSKCFCTENRALICEERDCLIPTKSSSDSANETLAERKNTLPEIQEGETCVPGRMYKNECNTCRCTPDFRLMCTKMACIDLANYNKLGKGKKALRDLSDKKRKKQYLPRMQKGILCKPGKLYRSSCKRCFCTEKNNIICSKKNEACQFDKQGNPLPIQGPEDIQPDVPEVDTQDLQKLSSASEKCDAGKSYMVDCNYCLCLDNNNLLCQKKLCISYDDMNRMLAKEMSGKPCEAGEISLENCKECECVDGKTDCHVVPQCEEFKHQLLAAGDEPPPQMEPSSGKCVPNSIYRSDCNKCYCQPDGTLRCTQKTCLNYSQVTILEKQREFLEKHGL